MIYLDNNATTPLALEVTTKIQELLSKPFGNPSSRHPLGQQAAVRLHEARNQVANSLRCLASEVIFTGSGTESNTTALRGVLRASQKKHIILSAVEHPAHLLAAKQLATEGIKVSYISIKSDGSLNLEELAQEITEETALVSIMMANNETGVLFSMTEIAQLCQEKKVILHTDAVQAFGKIPLKIQKTGFDLVTISAHKIYGPAGIGILYLRKGVPFEPLIPGHQEEERRGGTENLIGIIGAGIACSLAYDRVGEMEKIGQLRDYFEEELLKTDLRVRINGKTQPRVPNTSNLSFKNIEAQRLLILLNRKEIYCSAGSACAAGKEDPSHVLAAMKVPSRELPGTVRISLGKDTTKEHMDLLLQELQEIIPKITPKSRYPKKS